MGQKHFAYSILLAVLMVFIISLAIAQPADEQPEPNLGAVFGYEAEIAWGSKTKGD